MSQTDNEWLDHFVRSIASPRMRILELGVEYGKSTQVLHKIAQDFHGELTAIDMWEDESIYQEFLKLGISAKRINLFDAHFPDSSLDVIYFDACYTYPDARRCLGKYLPKLKKGGMAVGHGAEIYWSELSPEVQERLEGIEEVETALLLAESLNACPLFRMATRIEGTKHLFHANLSRALYEVLNDKYKIYPYATMWAYEIQ